MRIGADDPIRPLLRELGRRLGGIEVRDQHAEPWASITFSGHRVKLVMDAADGAAAERMLVDLPEAEWALPGRTVAEIMGVAERLEHGAVRLTVEALLLDEA